MFFCHVCDCGKLLTLVCRAHAHLPVIFSIQETRSWDVPNLELLGHVCYGGNFGARHTGGSKRDVQLFSLEPFLLWPCTLQTARKICILSDIHHITATSTWTDEDDNQELNEMYGPLCWQGCGDDQGRFKMLRWYGIMKEFSCKVTSTWSSCGRGK